MKWKKFLTILMSAVMIFTLTACGNDSEKSAAPDDKSKIKIGMLKYLNAGELEFNDFMKKIAETFSLKMPQHEVVFFDNLNSMQMAFDSGQIDEISTYTCVADYLAARNANVGVLKEHTLEFIDAFCLAMRESDQDLYKQVDDTVKAMRDDGTLDALTKKYITDLQPTDEPEAVDIQHFDGADTIKVAITGDLPPLDLVLADGKAAGFNTAVLSEIGKRLQKNIELVQIESAARAAALESGRVDISFWAIVPISEIIPADADKPAGVILSTPYYRGKIVHVGWGQNIQHDASLGQVADGLK